MGKMQLGIALASLAPSKTELISSARRLWLAESLSHLVIQKLVLASDKIYLETGSDAAAYGVASEAMACNMAYEDAAAGIDVFLGRRRPAD